MEFLQFILLLYLFNFIFIYSIFPDIVKSKVRKRNNQKIQNQKIKVSLYRYISSCFTYGVVLGAAIYKWLTDGMESIVLIICLLVIFVIGLFRLTCIFPRRYFLFCNKKLYYHNGIREICIEKVKNITTIHIGVTNRISYWYMMVKHDGGKRIFADVLLFQKPENICTMIDGVNSGCFIM